MFLWGLWIDPLHIVLIIATLVIAAAMTYVAAAVTSILTLLYYISIARRS